MRHKSRKWLLIAFIGVIASCSPDTQKEKDDSPKTIVVYEQTSTTQADPNRVLGTLGEDNNLNSMQNYDPPPGYFGFDRLFPDDDLNWAANF